VVTCVAFTHATETIKITSNRYKLKRIGDGIKSREFDYIFCKLYLYNLSVKSTLESHWRPQWGSCFGKSKLIIRSLNGVARGGGANGGTRPGAQALGAH